MTLTQLKYFREVAKTNNFTVAAKSLFVSQSSISISIKELEKEIGFPLFLRNGRKIELSSFGELFYPYVCQALSSLDEGLTIATQQTAQNSVRIGCFVNTSHTLVPWFLKGFPLRDFQIALDVQQTYVDMFPDLINGKYDLIITTCSDNIPSCNSAKIASQAVFLMVPVTHPLAFRQSITINDVKNEQLLFVAPNSYMDIHIKQMFAAYDLVPNLQYSPDYSTLALDVTLGRGIALTTKLPVDEKMLAYIPVNDPLSLRSVYLSWPTNRKLSSAANLVMNHIISVAKSFSQQNLIF